MTEQWATIPGYEGFYEVSSIGRVRSVQRIVSAMRNGQVVEWHLKSRIIKPRKTSGDNCHLLVTLSKNAVHHHVQVHRLVLEAFVGPCPQGMTCLHYNDVADDNRLENLRWGTYSDNMYDCVRNGNHHCANKTHCKRGHPFSEENTIRRHRGGRFCRECMRMHGREYARRKNGHKPRVYRADMTECRNGHPISPENTYTNPDGEQSCRICRAESMRRHKERKRLEQRS